MRVKIKIENKFEGNEKNVDWRVKLKKNNFNKKKKREDEIEKK